MVKVEELENVEFAVSFRGYNSNEVDEYIDNVVKNYKEAIGLCENQAAKIAELEDKLAKISNGENVAPTAIEKTTSDVSTDSADIDKIKLEYECYLNKIRALRRSIHDFKSKAFGMFQEQIIELQNFDLADGDCLASINDDVSQSKQLKDGDTNKSAVQTTFDDDDISKLLDDISEQMNFVETAKKNNGSFDSVNKKTVDEDDGDSNMFNSMFITGIDGE